MEFDWLDPEKGTAVLKRVERGSEEHHGMVLPQPYHQSEGEREWEGGCRYRSVFFLK